ncbi:hypothetical protein BRC81_17125 [Halobacteriales archaeon QS_1_68_20]|nr:MAG: hypothetical protein BRC81_17125 [Halobacteriales archaeon QS_1_68_20]
MTSTGADSESSGAPADASDESVGRDRPWYLTKRGMTVFCLDAILALVVVAGTTDLASTVLAVVGIDWESAVTVDPFVYLFGVLGALGYVFTALVRNYDRSTGELIKFNVRMLAALPLAASVYLLAELLFGDVPTDEMLAGAAFVAGLYVNQVYERLGALADRLFRSRRS